MAGQVNIVLLTLGALQGALLSWYLLRNQKFHLSNIYFILILLTAGLQLTFKVVSKVWLMEHYSLPYFLSYNLPYLMGPLLFLYVKARGSKPFLKLDLLHFIPFLAVIAMVTLQVYNLSPFRYRGISAYGRATIQLASLLAYAYFAWRLIQREEELKRLKTFLIGLVCGEGLVIITLAVMYVYYGRFPDVRPLFVVLTLFIYWLSYKQIENPDLFIIRTQHLPLQLQFQSHRKYNHSSLKPEEAGRIAMLLNQTMHQQKAFLDSDLTIDSLSAQVGVSRHHISQVLNERFQLTYSDFVNDLRLREAKTRLQDIKYGHYTIAAVAMDSGFSSVSNFNELFKKKFGQTPSQARSERLGKMTA